ncbi:MAG: HD domain-containing protein [Tepidisphaeraceae bacterium]
MPTLQRAIEIAVAAHREDSDKQGGPYILHPMRVMLCVQCPPGTNDEARIVAMLHDVVEDTDTTLDDIRAEGFSEAVVHALSLVTHDKGSSYADYVVRAKQNPIARAVKLADLHDNSRLDRCLLRAPTSDKDMKRLHRYVLSYKFLTDQLTENEFRHLMTDQEPGGE